MRLRRVPTNECGRGGPFGRSMSPYVAIEGSRSEEGIFHIQTSHLTLCMARRERNCGCDRRRLTHHAVSTKPCRESRFWGNLTTKRAFTEASPSMTFQANAQRASTMVYLMVARATGRNALNSFRAASSRPLPMGRSFAPVPARVPCPESCHASPLSRPE